MSDRFKSQNYDKLVKHHRALGVPWTDPTFPPSDASVGAAKVRELGRKVEWKRPSVSASEAVWGSIQYVALLKSQQTFQQSF